MITLTKVRVKQPFYKVIFRQSRGGILTTPAYLPLNIRKSYFPLLFVTDKIRLFGYFFHHYHQCDRCWH